MKRWKLLSARGSQELPVAVPSAVPVPQVTPFTVHDKIAVRPWPGPAPLTAFGSGTSVCQRWQGEQPGHGCGAGEGAASKPAEEATPGHVGRNGFRKFTDALKHD